MTWNIVMESGAASQVPVFRVPDTAFLYEADASAHPDLLGRLYTHTDEDALRRAVATLPSMTGDATLALPSPDPLAAFMAKVKALAESMTAKTWKAAQGELLALAAPNVKRWA